MLMSDAASRVASCGHSLQPSFLWIWKCFRFASIDVHSVYLPPPKLDFSYKNQDWIQKDADEVVNRAELLFSEVLNALSQIAEKIFEGSLGVLSSDLKHRIAELEEILQKEKSEFEESLEKILRKETMKGQLSMDVPLAER